jgi:hypothetical protein
MQDDADLARQSNLRPFRAAALGHVHMSMVADPRSGLWPRRLDGHNQLPKIILSVRFTDGIEVVKPKAQAAAA